MNNQAENRLPGEGDLVSLAACPPGPFRFNGHLGFKTEYGAMEPIGTNPHSNGWRVGNRPDAYCLGSGEFFCGGANTPEERDALLVEPLEDLIPASDLEQVTRERDGLREALSIISGLSSAGNFSITNDAGRGLLQRIEEIADTALNNLDNRND